MLHFGSPDGSSYDDSRKRDKREAKKNERHRRALVIAQDEALKGLPYRSLKEIKRSLK